MRRTEITSWGWEHWREMAESWDEGKGNQLTTSLPGK